jgi:hypothetical protein
VNDRDDRGRFKKGVSGNPNGRPKKSREQRYMSITMTACTFSDWKAIVKRAVEDAKRGDSNARKFLADYLVGPPVQKHAVANVDWANLVIDWGDGDDPADIEAED